MREGREEKGEGRATTQLGPEVPSVVANDRLVRADTAKSAPNKPSRMHAMLLTSPSHTPVP